MVKTSLVQFTLCGVSSILHLISFLDMEEGEIGDMCELGITESFQVKRQVVVSAAEAAEMILRVDDIVRAAPRQRMSDQCGY